ncbi:hypothetical protein D046_5650B, partial [Vibrio parahaemolyticus V-223/04]
NQKSMQYIKKIFKSMMTSGW